MIKALNIRLYPTQEQIILMYKPYRLYEICL
ncbi:helix-turn-helix domain-containing protein [Clostridium liquoris]|nr:helix-turn-helix domain-containing protein [Clostridium liquoris]